MVRSDLRNCRIFDMLPTQVPQLSHLIHQVLMFHWEIILLFYVWLTVTAYCCFPGKSLAGVAGMWLMELTQQGTLPVPQQMDKSRTDVL